MEFTTRRRRALSTVLALFLAVESVSAVAAVARVSTASPDGAGARHALPASAPAGAVLTADALAATGPGPASTAEVSIADRIRDAIEPAPALRPSTRTAITAPVPERAARASAPTLKAPRPKVASSPTARATTHGAKPATVASYKGRNHVWIPSLGINRSVSWFPCDRQREPDNYVYRWGCAGANNVYLLGHAWGVFKPLHDAYVSKRLKVGMKAYYADAKSKVHVFKVKWWKLTAPTTAASWAWAAQSVPSMTLQTCVGKHSEYRLMVRLVEVR
jgi:hypothetical protein